MSRYLNIDSMRRVYNDHPNPCNFILNVGQFEHTNSYERTVNNLNPMRSNANFTRTVELLHLIVPFDVITYGSNNTPSHFADLPFIGVDVHSSTNDSDLITSADGTPGGLKFICERADIVTNSGGAETWILFKAPMLKQVMRFEIKDNITFVLRHPDGGTINLAATEGDLTKRVQCLLRVTPYERDGSFDNHHRNQRKI